jgi:hypothetical protein
LLQETNDEVIHEIISNATAKHYFHYFHFWIAPEVADA